MSIGAGELGAVLAEVAREAAGWRVKKIYQPRPDELVFSFAGPKTRLLVSADKRFARIHLSEARGAMAETPAPFALLLRKHLCGKRITGYERHVGERIFCLLFDGKRLFVKLFGAGGFLLAEEDGTVIGSSGFGGVAPIKTGEKYGLPPPAGLVERHPLFEGPPSAALEKIYAEKSSAAGAADLRAQALSRARAEVKRLTRLLEALEGDRANLARYAPYRHYGDICRTYFHRLKRGLSSIILADPATGAPVDIPLSPELSPAENVEQLYKKYKKHVSGAAKLEGAIAAAHAGLERGRREMAALEEGVGDVPPVTDDGKTVAAKKREKPEPGGFRRAVSADGFEMLVGRNDRQNDDLVRHSNGNDLWFHVRDFPGSHVVVRATKGREVPPGTIAEAARLALKHSSRARDGKGTVVYTQIKYLRRPKGAPPGKVLVTREKTLHVALVPGER